VASKIFKGVPAFKFLSDDSLFKGFFFMFVYKDFVLREVVDRINDQVQLARERQMMAHIEKDFASFIENDLTNWVNLLLQCDIF